MVEVHSIVVWYIFIFGLVLRERNHGAVPSRSNHDVSGVAFEGLGCSRRKDCVCVAGGHFRSLMTTAMTRWQQLFRLLSLPTTIELTDKDFPKLPAFAQQLRHLNNARVVSRQQWNGSSLYESSQRLGMTNGLPFQWCIGRLEHYHWMRHGLISSSAGNLIYSSATVSVLRNCALEG